MNISFAKENINSNTEIFFSKFILKLEKKYTKEKEIFLLEKVNFKIKSLLEKKQISDKKVKILLDIVKLSNEEIFKLETGIKIENNYQKLLEVEILDKLKNKLNKIKWEFFTKEMWKQIFKISDKQEFIEDNSIKKLKFSNFYKITSQNYKYLKSKKWIIVINENGDNWLVENYVIETKNPYSNNYNFFKNYITYNNKYILENNNFYSYNFSEYTFFEDKYWFYESALKRNNIDKNKTVLYFSKNKKYNFITKYNKTKLINSDIIYWITDKKLFLKHLINDKLHLTEDTDLLFVELKTKILKLTKGLNKEDKIKEIYNFVLNRIQYTEDLDINDKKIFSWILSYKNSDWVCEWYAKLASYSLKIAGIPDVDVIRWDVIDANDFPQIGHAWLKIWESYYDPTFDDPIWQKETKKYEDYTYYRLPKDLLYANRFNYLDTPEDLKSKSLDYRKNFVNKRLTELLKKYDWKKYSIFEWVSFNKKYNITIWNKFNIKEAKKIIPFYNVTERNNLELILYIKWKKKNIVKLQYYTVNDSNIEQIIKQRKYNLDWLYLFDWNFPNGKKEYRIWFNVDIK